MPETSRLKLLFLILLFETIIILIAVLLLFGAKKIPEIARGLGKGINEFKKGKEQVAIFCK